MARSIWSGAISFGLVSVSVRMFTATESKELRFHFLDRRDLEEPIAYEKGQPLPEREEEEPGEVVDLMATPRESVERTKKKQRKTASRRKAS